MILALSVVNAELGVQFPVNLLSQPGEQHSLDEELIAEEEHYEVDDQREADLSYEVSGVREDVPGVEQDAVSMLVAMIFAPVDCGHRDRQIVEHLDSPQ